MDENENMRAPHWYAIQADLAAIRVALFALIATHPNPRAYREEFQRQREYVDTATLHSELPEQALEQQRAALDRMQKVLE